MQIYYKTNIQVHNIQIQNNAQTTEVTVKKKGTYNDFKDFKIIKEFTRL